METIKLKAVISILLIFIAGVAVGAVVTFFLVNHDTKYEKYPYSYYKYYPKKDDKIKSGHAPSDYKYKDSKRWLSKSHSKYKLSTERPFFEYLSKELDLTPEQRKKIKKIIEETHEEYRQILEQKKTKYEKISKESRKKIMEILNEEQKIKFEKIIHKSKRKYYKSRKRKW